MHERYNLNKRALNQFKVIFDLIETCCAIKFKKDVICRFVSYMCLI